MTVPAAHISIDISILTKDYYNTDAPPATIVFLMFRARRPEKYLFYLFPAYGVDEFFEQHEQEEEHDEPYLRRNEPGPLRIGQHVLPCGAFIRILKEEWDDLFERKEYEAAERIYERLPEGVVYERPSGESVQERHRIRYQYYLADDERRYNGAGEGHQPASRFLHQPPEGKIKKVHREEKIQNGGQYIEKLFLYAFGYPRHPVPPLV